MQFYAMQGTCSILVHTAILTLRACVGLVKITVFEVAASHEL